MKGGEPQLGNNSHQHKHPPSHSSISKPLRERPAESDELSNPQLRSPSDDAPQVLSMEDSSGRGRQAPLLASALEEKEVVPGIDRLEVLPLEH